MIRLAGKEDLNFIYGCYMHPQVNPYLLYEPMSRESFQPIFDDLLQQGVKYVYGTANENIGMFKLVPLQHRNHHIAYLGGLANSSFIFRQGRRAYNVAGNHCIGRGKRFFANRTECSQTKRQYNCMKKLDLKKKVYLEN